MRLFVLILEGWDSRYDDSEQLKLDDRDEIPPQAKGMATSGQIIG